MAEDTRYIIPCGLPPDEERVIQDDVLHAFRGARLPGWGRVDLMLDRVGEALSPRGQHVAGHDRPLARADGGAPGRHVATRTCASRSSSCAVSPPAREALMWDNPRALNGRRASCARSRSWPRSPAGGVALCARRLSREQHPRRRRRRARQRIAQVIETLQGRVRGNFFAVDLDEMRARVRDAALGAARRGAPRLAGPARGDARGARGARALGTSATHARQHARRALRGRVRHEAAVVRRSAGSEARSDAPLRRVRDVRWRRSA